MKKLQIIIGLSLLFISCTTNNPSINHSKEDQDLGFNKHETTDMDIANNKSDNEILDVHRDIQKVSDNLEKDRALNEEVNPDVVTKDNMSIDTEDNITDRDFQNNDIKQDVTTGPEVYTLNVNKGQQVSLKLVVGAVLDNPEKGMGIWPDGTFTWTPTNDQAGHYRVKVLKDKKTIALLDINVSGPDIKYDGVFVYYGADKNGSGTPKSPFNSITSACNYLKKNDFSKTNIYFRGGVYKNPGFGHGLDNGGFELVRWCNGSAEHQIHIKPWGNEYVKFMSDGGYVFRFKSSSYLVVEGFELQGVARKIKFDDALNHWWISRNYYKGGGIVFVKSSHDITLQNNVIHDFPGPCVAVHGCDAFDITHNVVYDCAWWTIAGTGGIVVTQSTKLSEKGTKLQANLIFAVESRIFSRVFSKGFAHLVIDEGEATLFQQGTDLSQTRPGYDKSMYIKGNFLAYNGKGITINKADNAIISNNSMYFSKAIRVGSNSSNITIKKNVVQVDKDDAWISISRTGVTDLLATNNYFNKGATQRYTPNSSITITNNKELDRVFDDPANFQVVSTINGAGASINDWKVIKDMLKRYRITVEPDKTWKATPEEKTYQTKKIIESAKDLGPDVKINCKYLNDNKEPRVIIQNLPQSFVKKNHLPSPDFILKLRYPYDGEKCDIK